MLPQETKANDRVASWHGVGDLLIRSDRAESNTSAMDHPKYRPDVDGLRAVAVLSVIGFHLFPGRFPGGYVGVDVFFVISGYLITDIILRNLQDHRFSLVEFYFRRIRRIFPALLVVLVTACVIGYFVLLPYDFAVLAKNVAGGAAFLGNHLSMSESGYFAATSHRPLLHLWSLGIEEQFYLFWPLLLAVSWWKWRRLSWVVVVALFLVSFGANLLLVRTYPVATFFTLPTRFWELAMGGLLAYAATQRYPAFDDRVATAVSAIGLSAIVVSVFAYSSETLYPGFAALVPTVGAFLLILAGPQSAINKVALSNPVAIFFGKISYPLYLWHWMLFVFMEQTLVEASGTRTGRLGLFAVSVVLSWATYRFVEIPIRFRMPYADSAKAVALLCAMLLVGAVGLIGFRTDGFEARLPVALQGLKAKANVDVVTAEWRPRRCWLFEGESTYASECAGIRSVNNKLVLLWGDSFAAALYPGLVQLKNELGGFDLAQYTAWGCPPILGETKLVPFNRDCQKLNNFVLDKIADIKPDLVILQALWSRYNLQDLARTLDALKKMNLRVVIIGEMPTWKLHLPDAIYKYWREHGDVPQGKMTDYLLNDNAFVHEPIVREFAQQQGVRYIPTLPSICSERKCMWNLSDEKKSDLTFFDYGHLSPNGAIYFVRSIADQLPLQK